MHHFLFKNIVQVFIKFTHSFVAIELLTFCKNAKNYFIAQESSRYSVRKQDWFFLLFKYKIVSQKNGFLYMNEKYNDCHHRKTTRTFIYKKPKKLPNVFIYKKPDTFQKARQFPLRFYIQKAMHLTLEDFHEIFEVRIYIQRA